MRTSIAEHIADANKYWDVLKDLDSDVKLDLIGRLSASLMKHSGSGAPNAADKYYGAWQDDKPAEELAAEIRSSRMTGTRNIALFD